MTGDQLKRAGQSLALDHAGKSWTDSTLDKLRAFCKARKDMGAPTFRFEEFRAVAEHAGWPMPPDHHVWGALPRLAKRAGIILPTTKYEPAQSEKTHAHPVRVWVAL
jgi:hypothetical protein